MHCLGSCVLLQATLWGCVLHLCKTQRRVALRNSRLSSKRECTRKRTSGNQKGSVQTSHTSRLRLNTHCRTTLFRGSALKLITEGKNARGSNQRFPDIG